jgi:hypothetical protein
MGKSSGSARDAGDRQNSFWLRLLWPAIAKSRQRFVSFGQFWGEQE